MIAHPSGLIFVHIPKCAGMSVEAALGGLPARQLSEQHWTGELLRRHYPEEWSAYHKFTVVRHPLDRAWSYVRFLRRLNPVWRRHLKAVDDATLLRDLLFGNSELARLNADTMLTGEEEILKFEELSTAWPAFAERHGLPSELPRRNSAPGSPPPPPPLIRLLAAEFFGAEHERFGYPRPDPAAVSLTLADRGALCWARLHAWAKSLARVTWSTDTARATEAWLERWRASLPDPSWIARYDAAVAARPARFASGNDVVMWAQYLHDDVNRALGKPLWEPWEP